MITKNFASRKIVMGRNLGERLFSKRQDHDIDYYCRPSFPIYKYMHSADLKYIIDHQSIKIGTLYGYTHQDGIGGQSDPNEFTIEAQHLHIDDSSANHNKKLIDNLYATGLMDLKPGAIDTYVGRASMRRKNYYICCYSRTFSKLEMDKWNKLEGYDCCVEIFDAIKFIKEIQQSDYLDKRILCFQGGQYIGGAVIDEVVYADFPFDFRECDFTYFSFHKDKKSFSWQNEIRISWPTRISDNSEPLIMKVPRLSTNVRVLT
jgi:hypothetical protein